MHKLSHFLLQIIGCNIALISIVRVHLHSVTPYPPLHSHTHTGVHGHACAWKQVSRNLIEYLLLSIHLFHSKYFSNVDSLLSQTLLQGTKACAHMFGRQGFQRLIAFLLGNTANGVDEVNACSCNCFANTWGSYYPPLFSQILEFYE